MKPKKPFGKVREEAGFTLLETLIEVLLVSLALGALAFLAVTTFDAWKRSSAQTEARLQQSLFLAALDQAAERVEVPFFADPEWGRGMAAAQPGRPLLVPWYRGNPDAFLELGSDGKQAWLRSWDANFNLPEADAVWTPLADADGRVVGVQLQIGRLSHSVRFGSVPRPAAGSQ